VISGRSPDLIRIESIRRLKAHSLTLAQIPVGDQPLTFTPFNGHGTASLVSQEMLERCLQVRTQAPFLLAHNVQVSAFQQQRKEALREIFCFFGTSALSPYEIIN
jgi:hypothetical protein